MEVGLAPITHEIQAQGPGDTRRCHIWSGLLLFCCRTKFLCDTSPSKILQVERRMFSAAARARAKRRFVIEASGGSSVPLLGKLTCRVPHLAMQLLSTLRAVPGDSLKACVLRLVAIIDRYPIRDQPMWRPRGHVDK